MLSRMKTSSLTVKSTTKLKMQVFLYTAKLHVMGSPASMGSPWQAPKVRHGEALHGLGLAAISSGEKSVM